MNVGEYIKNYIKEDGRTSLWISEKLGMNYKTFVGKLNRNSLSADELLKISALIDMDLEEIKEDLDYKSLFMEAHNFVYVPIKINNDDIFGSDEIYVEKMELMDKKCKDKSVLVGVLGDEDIANFSDINKYKDIKIYAFVKSEEDDNQYILEKVSVNYLKDIDEDDIPIKFYMLKDEEINGLYTLKAEKCKPRSPRSSSASGKMSSPRSSSMQSKISAPRTSYFCSSRDFYISSKELK